VIYPAQHYGRDGLAGISLFLTPLAKKQKKCSELRKKYPDYFIAKKRVETTGEHDLSQLCDRLMRKFPGAACDTRDGIRLDLSTGWVQVRKSNTEPIIRVYAEDRKQEAAEKLASDVIMIVKNS
jgi:phosphomannomutase